MKNLILFIFIFFLSNCGYTTVYNNTSNDNIDIVAFDIYGDSEINNLIKLQLANYINTGYEKKISLEITTDYNKTIITKDATGKASDYQLYAKTNCTIKYNEKVERISFEEKLNIKNSDNLFELRNYEKKIKDNFAESIKNKLSLKLKTIK